MPIWNNADNIRRGSSQVMKLLRGGNSPWAAYNVASGGTVTTVSNYNGTGQTWRVHRFDSNGTFSVSQSFQPFRILVVAGGGSSGDSHGSPGQGGGGGCIFHESYNLTTGSYGVTVGNGAAAAVAPYYPLGAHGNNGGNSVFGSLFTAIGGGGGGNFGNASPGSGNAGGSGGGGATYPGQGNGGGGAGTAGQGHAGAGAGDGIGGGGGGAGGPGGRPTAGAGRSINITGTAATYSSGGGSGRVAGPGAGGGGAGTKGVVIVAYRIA